MQTRRVQHNNHKRAEPRKLEQDQTLQSITAERYVERLKTLQEMSVAITSTLELGEVVALFLEKTGLLIPYSIASVWLMNKERGALECFATRGMVKGDRNWTRTERANMRSFAMAAIEDKPSLKVVSLRSDPLVSDAKFLRRDGTASYGGVRLVANGVIQGVLCVMTRTEHQFTEEEIADLTMLARQAALAIHNSRLYEQTKKQARELSNLARHIESVREIERSRIARELHDELAQTLTALKMDIAWLRSRLSEDQLPVQERARAMSKLIDTTMETVRNISATLRPAILDDFGFLAAMQWYARDFETRTGIRCRLSLPEREMNLDKRRSTDIFRVFQETLTNVARHASATEVNISLKNEADRLVMVVGDNGRGITESQIYDVKSLGLLGMRERALLLGGGFSIRGVKDKGTTVTVRIPLGKFDGR